MIVITDSLGNQLHHFVDTACYACDPFDAAADSKGFIYVAAKAFGGKASLIKYDTLGNRLWLKQFCPYGIESYFQCIDVISDTLIIAGGAEATDNFGGKSVLVGYNNLGDTLWSMHFGYGGTVGFNDIKHDSTFIYTTGNASDTFPPYYYVNYLRIDFNGQNPVYKKLDNGRKQGWGIVSLSSDSILIGGRADIVFSNTYSFLSLIDSLGNVLETVGDSNYLFTQILKMDFSPNTQTIYTLSYDTVDIIGTSSPQSRLSAYSLPVINLQQPFWAKTVTGTTMAGFADLKLAKDETILHTSMATTNCPNCPYLLKADANTCFDLVCDTTFVLGISIQDEFNASLTLYPNPTTSGYLFYELKSDEYLQTVEILCYDMSGKYLTLNNSETQSHGELYKGRLTIGDNLSSGMYLIKFVVNNKYNLYGRFMKTD